MFFPQNCDGGLYVGLSGAAYTYHRLSSIPQLASEKDRFMELARDLLKVITRSISHHKLDIAAFLLGNAGTYAVAAVIYKELGEGMKSFNCHLY